MGKAPRGERRHVRQTHDTGGGKRQRTGSPFTTGAKRRRDTAARGSRGRKRQYCGERERGRGGAKSRDSERACYVSPRPPLCRCVTPSSGSGAAAAAWASTSPPCGGYCGRQREERGARERAKKKRECCGGHTSIALRFVKVLLSSALVFSLPFPLCVARVIRTVRR